MLLDRFLSLDADGKDQLAFALIMELGAREAMRVHAPKA